MLAGGDATEDDPASAGDIGDPLAIMEHSGSFSMQALQVIYDYILYSTDLKSL